MKYSVKMLLLAGAVMAASAGATAVERGVIVRSANVYQSPDAKSTNLTTFPRGAELVVLERVASGWLHVEPVGEGPSLDPMVRQVIKPVTGWILNKGLVTTNTPGGDQILYGEAVDSEAQASMRGGRKHSAEEAYLLYRMTNEYFPNSPLAGEALYRAADVRWQVERADITSRPSYRRSTNPDMHSDMDEELMRRVMKKYPHTKWSDLAAYHLLDNKLCGDWQGEPKCPSKEAEMYEKYAAEHPQSPRAAEALYQAAWRQACLVRIYQLQNQPAKSEESKTRALALAQRIVSQFPQQGDWPARARALSFSLEQGIVLYGPASE